MYLGYCIAGVGAVLLLLNGQAARGEDVKTNQIGALIALGLIVLGLVIQGFIGFE